MQDAVTRLADAGRARLARLLGRRAPDVAVELDDRLGEQAYRLTLRDGVVIEAGGPLGVRFAFGELAQSVWREEGQVALHVADSGTIREPIVADRTMYFNVAFGFSADRLTADRWKDRQWREVVEWLLDCRYSRIAFYLWANQGLANEGSTIDVERNIAVRRRLRSAMQAAQESGMKVAFWFAPANLPQDLLDRTPDLRSPAPYPTGFPTLCPSQPGALDVMKQVYAEELHWFREADAFQVWFYDPGGCWCDVCRTRPAQAAVDQLRAVVPLMRESNPAAEVEVSAWPVWANEPEFGVVYREDFVRELGAWIAEQERPVTVLDTPVQPGNVLADVAAAGAKRAAFYLNTNLETGWCFFQPSFSLVEQIRADAIADGYEQTVVMRIEEGTRWPQDALIGAALWEPFTSMESTAERLATSWTGDADAGARLAAAIVQWDRLLTDGAKAVHGSLAEAVRGIDVSASPMPQRVTSLAATAEVLDLLAEVARGNLDPQKGVQRVGVIMRNDPVLAGVAPLVEARFDDFVDWVGGGWAAHGAF